MKKFLGFTLSELMIAITILGILCAICLPGIINSAPNQNRAMMKKAYYNFSEVISDIINDFSNYPAEDGVCPENRNSGYIGFDCNVSSAKLPYLITKRVNLETRYTGTQGGLALLSEYSESGDTLCNGVSTSCYYLKLSDGMILTLPMSNGFTSANASNYILVGFDVNGNKKPNCYQGSTAAKCKLRKNNFDQFRMKLYTDGKLEVNPSESWAVKAIDVSSDLSGD